MSGRHQPLNGADSEQEWAPVWDSCCDRCGRLVFAPDRLHAVTLAGSLSYWCPACVARSQNPMAAMERAS